MKDYQSPIDIIYTEQQTKLENSIYEAVQKVNINVDKEELIKALKYDREQYNEGYTNGYTDGYTDGYVKAIEELKNKLCKLKEGINND